MKLSNVDALFPTSVKFLTVFKFELVMNADLCNIFAECGIKYHSIIIIALKFIIDNSLFL